MSQDFLKRLEARTRRRAKGSPNREDRRAAKEYLKSQLPFDIDEFLSEVNPAKLLAEPLGPTPDCLTPNEVATVARGHITAKALHVRDCSECQRTLRVFSELEQCSKLLSETPKSLLSSFARARARLKRVSAKAPGKLVAEIRKVRFYADSQHIFTRVRKAAQTIEKREKLLSKTRHSLTERVIRPLLGFEKSARLADTEAGAMKKADRELSQVEKLLNSIESKNEAAGSMRRTAN
jgi:hypothetical protein